MNQGSDSVGRICMRCQIVSAEYALAVDCICRTCIGCYIHYAVERLCEIEKMVGLDSVYCLLCVSSLAYDLFKRTEGWRTSFFFFFVLGLQSLVGRST